MDKEACVNCKGKGLNCDNCKHNGTDGNSKKEKLLFDMMQEIEWSSDEYSSGYESVTNEEVQSYIKRLKETFNFDYYEYQQKANERKQAEYIESRKDVKLEKPTPINPVKDIPCKSCGGYVPIGSEYNLCVRCYTVRTQSLEYIELIKEQIKQVANTNYKNTICQHSDKSYARKITQEEKDKEIQAMQETIFYIDKYLKENNMRKLHNLI